MKVLIIILFTIFLSNNLKPNEPFVVLEYKGILVQISKKLNKENHFIKDLNHTVNHKVKNGESLSGILNKYYGNSGLNMKIVEVSLIEMNKHAFVRGILTFCMQGKKIKIPSVNQIMNLVKNEKNNQNNFI